MKLRLLFTVLVCVSYVFPLSESTGKKGDKVDEYSYSYEYDGGDYNNGQPVKPVKPVDLRIPCYSCTLLHTGDYTQGMEQCNETFNSLDVPEVMCNHTCGMTQIWIKRPTDFIITRGCLPNCKELVSEDKIIRCCSKPLCNAFTSSFHPRGYNLSLITFFTCMILLNLDFFYTSLSSSL